MKRAFTWVTNPLTPLYQEARFYPPQKMKIAVIGTAGRNEDGQKLSKEKFFEMVALVSKLKDAKEATLVSGGAAWADHIAVVVFLLGNCKSLSLHLPCAWDVLREQYADTGEFDWRTNPGGTANH